MSASCVMTPTLLSSWRSLMEKILHVIKDINKISLRAVADVAPEGYASSGSYDCSQNPEYMGPTGQVITVASWLSIKEV